MNRLISALALFGGLVFVTNATAQPKKDAALEQAAAALKKLGGVAHTFEVAPTGEILVKTEKADKIDKAPPDMAKIPVFRFQSMDDALLAKLPKSEAAVGLDLRGTKVGDAGMKSVANLKNLHMISVSRTKV